MKTVNYNTRKWLNPKGSYATSQVSCFDGEIVNGGKEINSTFVSISDCSKTMRIYKTEDDTVDGYMDKLNVIVNSLCDFINHLYEKENANS